MDKMYWPIRRQRHNSLNSAIAFIFLIAVFGAYAQSNLPPCLVDQRDVQAIRQNCHGTLLLHGGATYVGEFRVGQRSGWGTMTWPSGAKYVGEWRYDKQHGQGRYSYPNGVTYVGEFFADRQTGEGIKYSSSGDILLSGRWQTDVLVQSFALDVSRFPFDARINLASASTAGASPVFQSNFDRKENVQKIQAALRDKNFSTARELLRPLLVVRDPWGLYILSIMDRRGDGGRKDFESAAVLAKEAAERNYPAAQGLYGYHLIRGIGVSKDMPEGIRLIRLAAGKNVTQALNLLGILHYEGTGVKQDFAEMLILWEKAASLGHAGSKANIAFAYMKGLGVSVDFPKAYELAKQASDQGSGWGSAILGEIYRDGLGVEKDKVKAIKYLELSARRDNVPGVVDLAELLLGDKPTGAHLESVRSLLDKAIEIDDWSVLGQAKKSSAMQLLVHVERLRSVNTSNSPTKSPDLPRLSRQENRVALVIGNSNYKFNRLDNPINDAADMAAALRSLNFEVTLLRDATLAQMRSATRNFEEAVTGADVALIFYAGHGIEAKGRNFMIPVNADIKREFELEDQAYNASQWLDMLEGAKGRNAQRVNIVILDACRDNTLTRSWRNTAGGLARMDAPSGTILVYSTAPGKVAADGAAGQRNSPFTKHFLQAIQTANTPIELVLRETRRRVVAETKGEQVPWEHSSLVGEFVFRLQR